MHLQGRRVVVVSRLFNTNLYYLCHSTEQAKSRQLFLMHEHQEEITDPKMRVQFLEALVKRDYKLAETTFEQHCDSTFSIAVEEFIQDEAGVNQMEEYEALQLEVPQQLEELRAAPQESEDATNFFDSEPEPTPELTDERIPFGDGGKEVQ